MGVVEAIAYEEGYYNRIQSRAARNNNAGNMNWGTFTRRYGATGVEIIPHGYSSKPRFAYFPSARLGWLAMIARLQSGEYLNQTLAHQLQEWAPAADGNSESSYLAGVMQRTRLSPDFIVTPADLYLPRGISQI